MAESANGNGQVKHPGGRPSKLTPEVQEKIVNLIKVGNYAETAARAAGISKTTYYNWMADDRPQYVEFRDAVETAEAEAESHAVAVVRRAMPDQWTAAMTYLERRYPDRWSRLEKRLERRENVDVTVLDAEIEKLMEQLGGG